jgi:hypothetical protein
MRDGSRYPDTDQVIPMYIRGAPGGAMELTGLRPGVHTVCAMVPIGPDPSTAPAKCVQVRVESGKAKVDVVVPKPKR